MLVALLQQSDAPEYAEPYYTICVVALLTLTLIYITGVPATAVVTALLWRQRTRTPQVWTHPEVVRASPPAPAEPDLVSQPASAGSATHGLLRLQAVEREVLALPNQPVPASTSARLANEIEELVAQYGEDPIVGGHAAGLRVILAAVTPLDASGGLLVDPPDPPLVVVGDAPDELRVGLGRIAATGRPIPARWAFSWHGHRSDRWPPEADRRRAELAGSFTRHYQASYPHGGMIVPLTGGKLTLRYTPVSARFGGRPIDVGTELPDVVELPDAVRRLGAVADAALRDLDLPVTR